MTSSSFVEVSGAAPVNMAVIKYWGKRDVKLILPLNSSLSATLDMADLKTHTTAVASQSFTRHRLWLNGKEQDTEGTSESAVRFRRCLEKLLQRAPAVTEHRDASGGVVRIAKSEWPAFHVHVVSENNFPTAAGLASSASGYACLVFVLAKLFGFEEQYPGELTTIARQGSGSACRSLYGGWVRWDAGSKPDGSDSVAVQVVDEKYWPAIRILVLVVNDQAKDTGSTDGMQRTVQTSPLMQHRADTVVPARLAAMERAIVDRDFNTFARITMEDSNQLHAVCLDTFPPISYLNDTSRAIIRLVHAFNDQAGTLQAAYTFDAGPNACIYTTDEHLPQVGALFLAAFPPPPSSDSLSSYLRDPSLVASLGSVSTAGVLPPKLTQDLALPRTGALKYILTTKVGPAPYVYPAGTASLVDPATGLPRLTS